MSSSDQFVIGSNHIRGLTRKDETSEATNAETGARRLRFGKSLKAFVSVVVFLAAVVAILAFVGWNPFAQAEPVTHLTVEPSEVQAYQGDTGSLRVTINRKKAAITNGSLIFAGQTCVQSIDMDPGKESFACEFSTESLIGPMTERVLLTDDSAGTVESDPVNVRVEAALCPPAIGEYAVTEPFSLAVFGERWNAAVESIGSSGCTAWERDWSIKSARSLVQVVGNSAIEWKVTSGEELRSVTVVLAENDAAEEDVVKGLLASVFSASNSEIDELRKNGLARTCELGAAYGLETEDLGDGNLQLTATLCE